MELLFEAIGAAYRRCLTNRGGYWQGWVARYAKPGLALLFLGFCGVGLIAFALYLMFRDGGIEAAVPPIAASVLGYIACSPIVLFHVYLLMNVVALLVDRSNGSIPSEDRKT
jgi:hypothetical protein